MLNNHLIKVIRSTKQSRFFIQILITISEVTLITDGRGFMYEGLLVGQFIRENYMSQICQKADQSFCIDAIHVTN